jgi:predicted RNA binding protein YcfA (HicA-like mRNA interferase family)
MEESSSDTEAWLRVAGDVARLASRTLGHAWHAPQEHVVTSWEPLDSGQVVRALKRAGFEVHRRTENQYVLRSDSQPARVVAVPRKAKSIHGALLRQILRAASLSESEFHALLGGP